MGAALDLIIRARDDVENIAVHLLGPPNKALSNKRELRWGETGKLCLTLIGSMAGRWRDWREDIGGDATDLIEQELGKTRAEAIAWIEEWFGGSVAPIDHVARELKVKIASADAERATRFKRQVASSIWEASLPFADSPAETYMLQTRFPGHQLPDAIYRCGALRWNAAEVIPGAIGAMIALMTDPETNKPAGIHRTYIDATFDRIERKMLGNWGAVRLWRDDEVTSGLSIGEGIESTIAGVILTGRSPAWAALDAGGIGGFPVLPGIESLAIFVDNDASRTGQRAAEKCAATWHSAGREAVLFEPRRTGDDFNKVLLGRAA